MAGPIDPIDDAPAGPNDGALTVPDGATITAGAQPSIEALLDPDTELHRKVLGKIMSRVNLSARYRQPRYDDWDRVDERMRLFQSLSRKARLGDKTVDTSKVEQPVKRSIVMPLSLAIAEVRRTQMLSLYLSRSPLFEIDGRSPDDVQPAKLMEAMIAYDCDRSGMTQILSGLIGDADKYGEGTVYDIWEIERGTKRSPAPIAKLGGMIPGPMLAVAGKLFPNLLEPVVQRNVPVSEGNRVQNIDPFCFFPDPRVPLSRLQRGEFCGHLGFAGRLDLLSKSTKLGGPYFNLDKLSRGGSMEARAFSRSRVRAQLQGEGFAQREDNSKESNFYALDHQQIRIIPKEWGLGDEETPVIWWFTVANEAVIIRAHEAPNDHGQFTYSTAESCPDPHPTMNPGMIENLDGIQRTYDWLYNSRIANVRQMMNNSLRVMENMIEAGDLENLGPGKHLRASDLGLKKLASGELTWDQIVSQLPVMDATGTHAQLAEALYDQAQRMTAAADPAMGAETQTQRTLGEVQSILASASQRIGIAAKLIDSQAIAPMILRMVANRQQFTSMDQYYRIVGSQARDTKGAERLRIGADDVQGDFDYIPNSGVMPADPSRNAETWTRVLQMVLTTPALQQPKPGSNQIPDVWAIFDETVRAMGIRDLDTLYTEAPPPMPMPVQVMPDEQVAQQAQAGNIVPMGQTS